MKERYKEGEEGWDERARIDKENLHDLVRYFEYGLTTGFRAARVSEEQEIFWANQLKELISRSENEICPECGNLKTPHPRVPGDDGSKGYILICEDCNK